MLKFKLQNYVRIIISSKYTIFEKTEIKTKNEKSSVKSILVVKSLKLHTRSLKVSNYIVQVVIELLHNTTVCTKKFSTSSFLFEEYGTSDSLSFMINFVSFRTFRGPIFYKQETGMYLDNFFL